MVFASDARRDMDNLMFNGDKTVVYRKNSPTEDLSYGSEKDSWTEYTIVAQGTIANFSHKLVKSGLLVQGESLIILRYQYTTESDGTTITPTLTPKKDDEYELGGVRFRIKTLTPTLGEDSGIICYEGKGVPITAEGESL